MSDGNIEAWRKIHTVESIVAIVSEARVSKKRGDCVEQNAKMLKALKNIARQYLTAEMDEDEQEHADYQGAYEAIVSDARSAIIEMQG